MADRGTVRARMRIIGLTGGIASGKSTVSALIQASGIPVVDADQVAREVVAPGRRAHAALIEAFGQDILTPEGTIDRARLGRIAFADAEARQRLNTIVHPEVRRDISRRLKQLEAGGAPLAVVDIPLLYETGDPSAYDEVVVVLADPEHQLERLMARDGLDREQASRRLSAQLPIAAKAAQADRVIDNRGSPAQTRAQVLELVSQWRKQYLAPP